MQTEYEQCHSDSKFCKLCGICHIDPAKENCPSAKGTKMVKYFHLEKGGGRLAEITEGEYEFRLRKHATSESHTKLIDAGTGAGHGFETSYGTCFALEIGVAQS